MKKKQKKSKKKRNVLKNAKSYKFRRKGKKTKRVVKRFKKKKIIKKRKNKVKKLKKTNYLKQIEKTQNESIILKLLKLQLSLKPEFNFKLNFKNNSFNFYNASDGIIPFIISEILQNKNISYG